MTWRFKLRIFDLHDLAEAILFQVEEAPLNDRTRLLVRDSLRAFSHQWGESKVQHWLAGAAKSQNFQKILRGPLDAKVGGFPSLMRRILEKTGLDKVCQYLEHLGRHVRKKLR